MTDSGRRWLPLLLAAAAASTTGCTAPTAVREAAATRTAAGSTWFLQSSGIVPPAASAPTTVGLSPVVPRPREPEVGPLVIPRGVPVEDNPPPATCGGYADPRRIVPGAVPGPGSATVSWRADGRPGVVGYRVQAVGQTVVTGAQPAPPRQRVRQRAGCAEISVTFTGLVSGDPYVFWLEEAVVDPQTSVVRLVQVGTSAPVLIG